jgi:hypothetical protein
MRKIHMISFKWTDIKPVRLGKQLLTLEFSVVYKKVVLLFFL